VISDTELRDVRTHCSHDSRNLVTKHRRRWNDIVSSKKQVGVTQPGGLHLDENFAPNWRGDVHILEVEPATECVEYKRLHVWPPQLPSNRPSVPKRPGEEPWAGVLPLFAFMGLMWQKSL
jgi:hypothetical protein